MQKTATLSPATIACPTSPAEEGVAAAIEDDQHRCANCGKQHEGPVFAGDCDCRPNPAKLPTANIEMAEYAKNEIGAILAAALGSQAAKGVAEKLNDLRDRYYGHAGRLQRSGTKSCAKMAAKATDDGAACGDLAEAIEDAVFGR